MPGLSASSIWCSALFGAMASLCAPLLAAEPATLGFEQALAAAYRSNPDLSAARWSIDIAEGERRQAGLIPNPDLSWDAEDTRKSTRTTTLRISQPIELGGKRGARIDVARRGQDIAALEVERQLNGLRADVILAFYGALRAQASLQLAEESQQVADRSLAAAQTQVSAGKVAPVEATRAQVQRAKMQLEVNRARAERLNAYRQLVTLMGSARSDYTRVSGDLDSLPALPDEGRLLGRLDDTVELRLAALKVGQQEATLELEKANRIPDLNVSIGSQYSAEARERVNLVGMSMPLPLFNRNQGNVLSAARQADQARDLRNAAELRVRGETQQALEQWATAQAEIQSLEGAILPSARSAVDTATRGFEMGKFAFIDVLDAQRTLIDSRNRYLTATASATQAWSRLERLYGDLEGLTDPGR